jgi:magnesium transporter
MARSPNAVVHALVGDFMTRYPDEAARELERLTPASTARQIVSAPVSHAAAVLERLAPQVGAEVFQLLREPRASKLLGAMEPEAAVALLAWLEPERREEAIARVAPAAARELRALAEYPPDSAGRLMDPRPESVREDATVREALIRLRGSRRHTVHDLFLIDDEHRLVGAVAVQDVAIAAPSRRVGDLTRRQPPAIAATASREDVVAQLAGSPVASVPVVDANQRLLGVIHPETLVSVAQEEAGADMQAMVGASRNERARSKVTFAVRKRLPWLQINLATAFLAAAVVGLFESLIAQFTALAVLLPVVAGQSGNTGAQALAVTMRGLALREVRVRHWFPIAVKEASVALLNGCAVAATTAAGVYLWSRSLGLTLVIGLAMVISMVAAGLAGAVIPMLLTAAGQDPAQSSSIILTTVTDVVGFFSFLGIATLLASLL